MRDILQDVVVNVEDLNFDRRLLRRLRSGPTLTRTFPTEPKTAGHQPLRIVFLAMYLCAENGLTKHTSRLSTNGSLPP